MDHAFPRKKNMDHASCVATFRASKIPVLPLASTNRAEPILHVSAIEMNAPVLRSKERRVSDTSWPVRFARRRPRRRSARRSSTYDGGDLHSADGAELPGVGAAAFGLFLLQATTGSTVAGPSLTGPKCTERSIAQELSWPGPKLTTDSVASRRVSLSVAKLWGYPQYFLSILIS